MDVAGALALPGQWFRRIVQIAFGVREG